MVKASEVVYKYYEVGFAVKHKKDGFKASSIGVLIGYKKYFTYADGKIIIYRRKNVNCEIVNFHKLKITQTNIFYAKGDFGNKSKEKNNE